MYVRKVNLSPSKKERVHHWEQWRLLNDVIAVFEFDGPWMIDTFPYYAVIVVGSQIVRTEIRLIVRQQRLLCCHT